MKLRVTMFGDFTIEVEEKPAFEYTGRTKKLWNLLAYMILNRNHKISQEALLQVAQLGGRSERPENALKNLMYRLRNLLAASPLPPAEYILCAHGVYSWSSRQPCSTDVEDFEQEWKLASNAGLEEEERLSHYLAAIKLYKGLFLPKSATESWVIPLASYYHRIYCDCLNNAYKIYSHQENYAPMIPICRAAIALDPYNENLNELYIMTMTKLGDHKQALQVYNLFIDRIYKELGATPSESMSGIYQEIIKTINHVQTDISIVKKDLKEADKQKGAYYCQYEIFKNMYRFLARGIMRTGQSVYLALFTVSDNSGELPTVKLLNSSMEALYQAIGKSLRIGDVYARFSSTQYVVMLPSVNYDNSRMIVKRILTNFNVAHRRSKIVVNYMLQPLEPTLGEE